MCRGNKIMQLGPPIFAGGERAGSAAKGLPSPHKASLNRLSLLPQEVFDHIVSSAESRRDAVALRLSRPQTANTQSSNVPYLLGSTARSERAFAAMAPIFQEYERRRASSLLQQQPDALKRVAFGVFGLWHGLKWSAMFGVLFYLLAIRKAGDRIWDPAFRLIPASRREGFDLDRLKLVSVDLCADYFTAKIVSHTVPKVVSLLGHARAQRWVEGGGSTYLRSMMQPLPRYEARAFALYVAAMVLLAVNACYFTSVRRVAQDLIQHDRRGLAILLPTIVFSIFAGYKMTSGLDFFVQTVQATHDEAFAKFLQIIARAHLAHEAEDARQAQILQPAP